MILFLCSCDNSVNKDEVTEKSHLQFSFNGKMCETGTRGVDLSNENLTSMAVFGYYTGISKFGNEQSECVTLFNKDMLYKSESGSWMYDLPRYWFINGYHHFFAFAPFEDISVLDNNSEKYPVIQYTVSERGIDQKDILWSFGELINRIYIEGVSDNVNFIMHHALSRISFSAVLSGSYTKGEKVKIVKIVLKNLYQNGISHFYFSDTSISEGTWITDPEFMADFVALESSSTEHNEIKSDLWLTESVQNIFTENGAFFMMPQVFSGRTAGAMPLIEVTFNRQSDNKDIVQEFNLNSPVEISGISAWNPGQAINYQLTYTGDNEKPFQLNAAVIPWETQNVDLSIEGTYLNVSGSNILVSSMDGGVIHFSTDGSSVNLTSYPSIPLILEYDKSVKEGLIRIPQRMPAGNYRLSLKCGVLERSIELTIK